MDRFDTWISRAMFLVLFVSIFLMLVVASGNYFASCREVTEGMQRLRIAMQCSSPVGVAQRVGTDGSKGTQGKATVDPSTNGTLSSCIQDVESVLQKVERTDTVSFLYTIFSLAFVSAGVFLLNKVRQARESQGRLQQQLSSTIRNTTLLCGELSQAYQISVSVYQAAIDRQDNDPLAWFTVVCPQLRDSLPRLKLMLEGMTSRREGLPGTLRQTFIDMANNVEANLGGLVPFQGGIELIEQMEEIRHLLEHLEESAGNQPGTHEAWE